MIKISSIFALGVFVAILHYLGFPEGVRYFLYGLSGVLIAVLALLIRRELYQVLRRLHSDEIRTNTDTFSERAPAAPQDQPAPQEKPLF